MLAMIMLCWVIYVAKAWSYEVRALFNVIVMLVSIGIFFCVLESMDKILPMLMVFIVLVGLYGIDKLIYVITVATVLLYGYHGLILQSFSTTMPEERTQMLLQMGNVFFMQYLVYMWTKRNAGGSNRLLEAIKELKEVQSS